MAASPTDEEVAAILAAVELVWPRPAVAAPDADDGPGGPTPAWRFSGRWWRRPIPVRRDRPWA